MTIYLIEQSWETDDRYRSSHIEEQEGYFTDLDKAKARCAALLEKHVVAPKREAHEKTERAKVTAREASNASARQRQAEFDVLVSAGIQPSFLRPSQQPPYEAKPFVYERGRWCSDDNYDVLEIEAAE